MIGSNGYRLSVSYATSFSILYVALGAFMREQPEAHRVVSAQTQMRDDVSLANMMYLRPFLVMERAFSLL